MNRPPITPKKLLAATAVVLLILSQLPTGAATTLSSIPRSIVALLTKPSAILIGLSSKLRPGRDHPADFSAGGDLTDQLLQAKAYASNLEQEIAELRRISQSFGQIQAILDLGNIRAVGGNVIAFNGRSENPILTIDIGSNDGVREGLAVVWGADLVGKVASAAPSTSDVQLVTAADTRLQVQLARPAGQELSSPMPAYIQLADDGRSFVTDEFPLDAPVEVGDLAHLADDSWQFRARGFIVGRVVQAGPHPDRPLLNKRVVIRPQRSLASVRYVAVLVPVEK
jgi:cell shape-determining protein MreC